MVVGTWPGGGNQTDLRVFRLQDFGKLGITLDILRSPLFVADTHHFHIKGRRMAEGGAFRPPLAGDRAIGKLDQVERVLNERVKLVERAQLGGVELAGHAAVQNGQRLRADVLAQLEELEEAKAKGLKVVGCWTVEEFVVPAVDEQRPLLHGRSEEHTSELQSLRHLV